MSRVLYRICCDVELPLPMQGQMPYELAYEMVCRWNEWHVVNQMAWLERCDEGGEP